MYLFITPYTFINFPFHEKSHLHDCFTLHVYWALKVSKFRKQIDLFHLNQNPMKYFCPKDRSIGQKYFIWFLVQTSTGQSFEIYRPLEYNKLKMGIQNVQVLAFKMERFLIVLVLLKISLRHTHGLFTSVISLCHSVISFWF